jgi:hypothetical protein
MKVVLVILVVWTLGQGAAVRRGLEIARNNHERTFARSKDWMYYLSVL